MNKGQIVIQDIISDEALKWGVPYQKNIDEVIKSHEKVVASFMKLHEISKSNTGFDQASKGIDDAKKATSELEKKQKLLISTQDKLRVSQRGVTKQLALKKEQLSQTTKATKLEAAANGSLVGSYNKISLSLQRNTQKWKALSKVQREGTKEGKALTKTIQSQEKQLKILDSQIGKHNRNVGRYSVALKGLGASFSSLKSALGLYSGIFAFTRILGSSLRILRDYEKQNATLSSVLQKESFEIKELTDDSKRLGAITVKTASEVSKLQLEYARLGFVQKEVLNLTEATINGSIALNSELDKTALVVGAVVKTFDEFNASNTGEIIDKLSLVTANSAASFSKLETALPIVGGAANSANVSFSRTLALLGKLFDAGLDATRSSTALRNIFLEAAEEGLSYSQILDRVIKSSDALATSYDEFGKRGAVSGAILAKNIKLVGELEEQLDKASGTAKSMADKELKTLYGELNLLNSAWEGVILNTGDANSINEKLRIGVRFITDNIRELIGVLTTVVGAWISYKVITIANAIWVRTLSKRIIANRIATTLLSGSVKNLSRDFKLLFLTIRSNPFGLFLAIVTALVLVYNRFSKSLKESTDEIISSNKAFISKKNETEILTDKTENLYNRYKKLKRETKLNSEKQSELNGVIDQLAESLPNVITGFDEYGNVLGVNSKKIEDFIKGNRAITENYKKLAIEQSQSQIKELERSLRRLQNVASEGSISVVSGIGLVINEYGKLYNATQGKNGNIIKLAKLTVEEYNKWAEAIIVVKNGIRDLNNDIGALDGTNELEDINKQIGSIVLKINNLDTDAEIIFSPVIKTDDIEKDLENAKFILEKYRGVLEKAKVIIETEAYVPKLEKGIAESKERIIELTGAYENLTDAQIKNLTEVEAIEINKLRDIISKNLATIKKIKKLLKDDKEEGGNEKSSYELDIFRLEQKIKANEEILESDKKSLAFNKITFRERAELLRSNEDLEIEISRITKNINLEKARRNKEGLDSETLIIEKHLANLLAINNKYRKILLASVDEDNKNHVKAHLDRIKDIESSTKAEYDKNSKALLENLKNGVISRETYNSQIEKLDRDHKKSVLTLRIDALNELLNIVNLDFETRQKISRELANLEAELLKTQVEDVDKAYKLMTDYASKAAQNISEALQVDAAPFENLFKTIIEGLDKSGLGFENWKEIASASIGVVSELGNLAFRSNIDNIDREIQENRDKYRLKIEYARDNSKQKELIELEAEKEEQKLQKKKRKEQLKQAKFQKALSIAQIAVDLASTIVKINLAAQAINLYTSGIGGSIFAGVQIPAAIGLAAAQTAAVLAAPVPKYKEGTGYHKGGVAIVGDGGVPEYTLSPSGEIGKTPSVPTLMNLEKGSKVFKNKNTYDNYLTKVMLRNIQTEGQDLSNNQAVNSFLGIDKTIEKAIEKGFSKAKVNNYIKIPKNAGSWGESQKNW